MKKLLLSLTLITSLSVIGQTNTSSISFDGVDDLITGTVVGSDLNVATNNLLTISAWIKVTNAPNTNMPIFAYYPTGLTGNTMTLCTPPNNNPIQQYALTVNQDMKLYFLAGGCNINANQFELGTGNVSNSVLNTNEWYYVSVTYDGAAVKLYINGVLDFEHVITASFDDYNDGVYYIGNSWNENNTFDGLIDNIEVWNKALGSLEINEYMECPPIGSEINLIGFWNLEEGSGTTTSDLTANANDGTLTNGPTWSTDVPAYNCNVGIEELSSQNKEVVKIVNLLGQEVEYTPNTVLIYIYSDGTSERVFKLEK